MLLKSLHLQHFRTYNDQVFNFSPKVTIIVGRNTAGKTNFVEALSLLSTGRSFKTDKDRELIHFGDEFGRVSGVVDIDGEEKLLEVIIAKNNGGIAQKKYTVNGVARRRLDFATHLPTVLFSPEDLDIIIDGPSLRRQFLDQVLSQTDPEYDRATTAYSKALRQRNALLEKSRDSGTRMQKQFEFWDAELIRNGEYITEKREEFVAFVNAQSKQIFDCNLLYDKSVLSKERLAQYEREEMLAGVTLVGPHRDDLIIEMFNDEVQAVQDVRAFGSRGQQRLAILQLRMLQVTYIEKFLKKLPLLVLDDIFSELDSRNIDRVLELVANHQTIVTTTHREFVPKELGESMEVVELGEMIKL